ncbi:hypothetical protein INR49_025274 [Caranx melampygus]|nr:hypothetical protein INR49_025274 [Caranx melampygus]
MRIVSYKLKQAKDFILSLILPSCPLLCPPLQSVAGKMSKRVNSGKRRRSSFSSEEDEKASKQDVTNSYEKVKRSHENLRLPCCPDPLGGASGAGFLKKGKGLSGPVAHLASFAISYIYNSLKSHEPNLWGQSMQQAAENKDGLNAENNDDRVLQCCLQFQSLYPESALILCTNDKNLCSKALLSGVKALSKNDLEAEAVRFLDPVHNPETTVLPHKNVQTSPPQPQSPKRPGPSAGLRMKYDPQHSEGEGESRTCDLSRCVSELEESLKEVLSDVLEVEMKEAFDNLWLEIVCVKPPWTLQDVLYCYNKHWIAVFGQIVPRKYQQLILNLTKFFNSGKLLSHASILTALREAKMFVSAFEHRSSRVPGAISALDHILNKLQPQVSPPSRAAISKKESPADDVPMSDDDEDQQPTSVQVSYEEVWALFENIWSNTCQMSSEVFKVLGFDHTMQSAQPAGGPPPQEALACLHRLSSMVTQLLQAFSSILSSAAPSLEQVQTVLSIIQSYKIVNLDSRLTAVDLLGCFSQNDYREKLRFGGTQLMGLKEALDHCVEATQHNTTLPQDRTSALQTNRCLE